MKIKIILKKFYDKLKSNNTINIITLYLNIVFLKIIPILLPFSLLGYDSLIINILRYIILGYLLVNLFITDFILRQSVKIRNIIEPEHSCEECSSNIVWNIQDNISNIVFYTLGTIIFKYNVYLNIYWRSYVHSLPIYLKNKLCIQKSIEIQYVSIIFGILNYIIELAISQIFPYEYCIIFMFGITYIIDCIIMNLDIKYYRNIDFLNVLLIVGWKISQCLTVGYIENKKRNYKNRDIVGEIIDKFNYLRNNTWYRVILWKEFQSLDSFISFGKTSVFYREHVLNFYDLLFTIINYLDNNTTIKIARKIKLLHISTIFKPFMSPENKFYIRMFESRKSIEPFVKQLLKDLDQSITNTKSEIIYEEMYNFDKKVETHNVKIIDKYY
jgi:hypothetical protein